MCVCVCVCVCVMCTLSYNPYTCSLSQVSYLKAVWVWPTYAWVGAAAVLPRALIVDGCIFVGLFPLRNEPQVLPSLATGLGRRGKGWWWCWESGHGNSRPGHPPIPCCTADTS